MILPKSCLENFAELIIQECAKRSSEAMGPTFDPDYVGRKIREHFGLKEEGIKP